jgi:hypothetical protein
MSDIRGLDPLGQPRDIAVDKKGHVFIAGGLHKTHLITIPGIVTGAAYTSGDAFGTKIVINNIPTQGTIVDFIFIDKDDEGINKELVLFDHDFTETADNSAFAVSDGDMENLVGVIFLNQFYNYGSNQVGRAIPALFYQADPRSPNRLYGQFVTRGTDNIAAAALPQFFVVVSD